MSNKENKRLMLDQFQGKTPEEQIEQLIRPINDLIDKTQFIDSKGIKLESGLGVVFKSFTIDVPSDWLEVSHDKAPFFQSGWTNFGSTWETLAIRKDNDGVVHMRGLVKSGTIGSVPVFKLPDAYKPPMNAGVRMTTVGNAAFALIEIQMDATNVPTQGDVQITVGSATYTSMRCQWEASDRTPIIPACFPYNLKTEVKNVADVRIIEVLDSTNNPVTTAQRSMDWQALKDGTVVIRNIPGLKPSTSYKITVAVFPR